MYVKGREQKCWRRELTRIAAASAASRVGGKSSGLLAPSKT